MEPSTTAEKTFTTLIVGGGVETLIVLLDLLKQSKVHELLSRDGLGILDKTNFFGVGNMENYVTRSTKSSALSFLRLLLKSPESEETDETLCELLKNGKLDESIAQVVQTFKNIASHPKIYELCMPMFRELLDTTVLARLLDEGLRSSSLAQSGYFLKLLGNSFLYHIKVVKNAQIFYPKKEVICLRLLNDGSILVTTKVMLEDIEIKKPLMGQDKGPAEKFQDFKTRRILLTTPGGLLQPNPITFPPEKTIEAENFLQESGYYKVHSNLTKQIKKKILVIGGTPTAFACLQLLLKGHEYNEFHEEVLNRNGPFIMKRQKLFERERVASYDIPNMKGSTPVPGRLSPHRSSSPSSSKGNTMKNQSQRSPIKSPDQVKEVIDDSVFLNSATYGSIKGNDFRLLAKCVKPLAFDEGDVVVLHRKDIKVYFENNKEANKMGYKFEAGDTNSKGEINADDGLKGDAKKLYFDILSKAEKRVKLVQTEDIDELRALVDDANYVIDCQGFEQQLIPIKDINGAPLKIKKGPNGGYLLDKQGRLVSEKGVIKGIYAIGYCFEGEKGDKSRIIEPYARVTKYNNFENTRKMLLKDETMKNLILDNKNFDPSEEHYEELSGGTKVTAFSSNEHKAEERKESQFDLETLSSASTGGDPNMYSTLRVFEKLNFDKSKNQNSKCKKHK